MRIAVPVALILSQSVLCAQGQTSVKKSNPETERLIATGKLWATVKYFHPYLAYRRVDWDKALVDALPKIRSAKSGRDYASALQGMLDELHDPASYAFVDKPLQESASIHIESRSDGTLVVSQLAAATAEPEPVRRLRQALMSAHRVVFDLRSQPGPSDVLSQVLDDSSIAKLLAQRPIDTPAQRTLVHNGLPPQSKMESDSGYYYAGFLTRPGMHIEGDSRAGELRVAFLLNENSRLPRIGCALLAEGKAQVLAESTHFGFADAATTMIPMGEDITAAVRLSEPVATREVKIVGREGALEKALASLSSLDAGALQTFSQTAAAPLQAAEAEGTGMRYPTVEYRILAVYEIWSAFRNFFAYRDLMDEDWDEVFTTFLPRFIAAKDARDYNLTISEMVTHTADSHSTIESAELSDYFGRELVGLRLRLVEKKPVITEVLDPEATKAGIRAGDVVTRVDGESVTERFHREARYVAGSTQQALGSAVMERILNGPQGSNASLTIDGGDGQKREVRLKRSVRYSSALHIQRSGDVTRILPGNIGYVDLDRLLPEQVDGMFERLRSTEAIIFDMRGHPHGTGLLIASRLTERPDAAAAIINGPLSLTPDLPFSELSSSASYFFVQKLPHSDKWKYTGKVVMLIDERTIGQGEHSALFFEAATHIDFVGTPTAGAVGDVTDFVVPGDIRIQFSGHDIRHANGGALQRLGLQPALTVAPTLEGIREAADEVLQKAIEYLSPATQKARLTGVNSERELGSNIQSGF